MVDVEPVLRHELNSIRQRTAQWRWQMRKRFDLSRRAVNRCIQNSRVLSTDCNSGADDGRVRLFPLCYWTNSPLTLIFCTYKNVHDHRLKLEVIVQLQGQRSMQKCTCYTSIYCSVLWVLTDGRISRFPLWRHQMRVSKPGVRHGAAEASARGGVQCVWEPSRPAWPQSSIEGSFFLVLC